MQIPSNKFLKGRHLVGERVGYDIDDRFLGEIQPPLLEETPIVKYDFDQKMVVGRQIAVNMSYICYGLKKGFIRVINFTNGLRLLLKGLDQRVTDMAFFAENVDLLASASIDGQVYVWKIEGHNDEKITANIVIAAKIIGEEKPVHPRVCWHCHNQEVLLVGIGNRILRLDTKRVGIGKVFSAEEPLKCCVDRLIDGIQFIGKHDGEVTDLSMCQSTCLVSASVDGTIKIWEDCNLSPIAELRPHDGLPVNSVTFLTSPHHIMLTTGLGEIEKDLLSVVNSNDRGRYKFYLQIVCRYIRNSGRYLRRIGLLNREVKIWAPDSKQGSLVPSVADSWHCTQTLELKSCAESGVAFFNQVVALSGFFLLANGMKNAIYVVRIDYEKTCMDYIAEFAVTMPILSMTGTHDLLSNKVNVSCVQTQAIQQYTLDLSKLPPPIYDVYEKLDPMRMASSKLPKGRHLVGERVGYDIDDRFLAGTYIVKCDFDQKMVVGRQIAVNMSYICYGLKKGFIRVINLTNGLRLLLKGHDQRVTDMAFFAENVHLLASASIDGRVCVWKIDGHDDKKITANIVIAAKIIGEEKLVHPRVCWHCHNQEVLLVGIGNRILRLDTKRVGIGKVFSAEEPLKCCVDRLIDGIQFIGKHDGEVTDLSMCQSTRLVSASVDGTIKIWEDCKLSPIAELRPHDGLPVNSVTFLTSPHHIMLTTGGLLNREVKIWAPDSKQGSLVPDSWHCTQTLELKSCAEPGVAFFNQVVALSGFFLLANGMKNAIYAVRIDYEKTCMDYIAEFTADMPILSMTGTHDLLANKVMLSCVQTQAVIQYTLDLSQLPPSICGTKGDFIGLEMPLSSPDTLSTSDTDISCPVSSMIPSGAFEPRHQLKEKFKHLVAPAELMATSSSEVELNGSAYEEKEHSRS